MFYRVIVTGLAPLLGRDYHPIISKSQIVNIVIYRSSLDLEVKMAAHERHNTPWYLWPFVALWKLLAVIVEMTGRLVAMIIGIVLMIVGVLVSLTIIGAIVGVPLAIVGLLLFVKGIF
jgi:hypothetical protein